MSTAGFNDVSWSGLLLLAVIYLNSRSPAGSARKAEFNGRMDDKMIDNLFRHGYLENRSKPDDRNLAAPQITQRGNLALSALAEAVTADRWTSFSLRPGDIVISSQVKGGTTWMQTICALLIFQTPDLPGPLGVLSPWLDEPMSDRHEVFSMCDRQEHRRFIKTHSPLADIAVRPEVMYVVIGRHPLDAAISLYHQKQNMRAPSQSPGGGARNPGQMADESAHDFMIRWVTAEHSRPFVPQNSLDGIMRHMLDAWVRRDAPNVVLLHYADLCADLEGNMRHLAARLGIEVPETLWPSLVETATFKQMRAAADRLQPLGGILKDNAAFFRTGKSGSGAEVLSDAELEGYYARAARALEPELLAWLHR